MEPSESAGRGLVDRLAIGALLGVLVISIGGAALLTVYLNRLGDAVAGLERVEPLGAYPGRPTAVGVAGVDAVNYLLTTTSADGSLQAVVIIHLSSSRRDLTLVSVPSELLVQDGTGRTTLAASFERDPLLTARLVETLTRARMDHQIRLDVDGFAHVVDNLGGIALDGASLDGREATALLAASPDDRDRAVRTAELLQAAFARVSLSTTITDPNRFDKVMDALTPCLVVDAALTSDEFRETIVESRVRADAISTWSLDSAPGGEGTEADVRGLATLRAALAADTFPEQAAVKRSAATPAPSHAPAGSPTVMVGASTVPATTGPQNVAVSTSGLPSTAPEPASTTSSPR